MFSRREALRIMALSGGGLALAPLAAQMRLTATGDHPKRFVFVVRSNGILSTEIQPKGLEDLVKVRNNGNGNAKLRVEALADRDLPAALDPIRPFKSRVTILQGLSGKMCRGSHGAGFGALGAYASSQGLPPRQETIDGALAKSLGGVFPHLGFEMHDFGAAISYPPLSALGRNKVLPYFADPKLAYQTLFGTLIKGGARSAVDIDRNVLDFMVGDVKRFQRGLTDPEKDKLGHYLEGFEALQKRQKTLLSMSETLSKVAPKLRDIYTSEIEIERLRAHFELVGASLIGGLTQVVSIRADSLGMRIGGLGLGTKTVHQMGHMIEGKKGGAGGEDFTDGKGEFETRAVVMKFHMELIAGLARTLDAVPEGDGTMLDNTVIVYLSDHGDRHHGKFYEWPMLTVGNVNGRLKAGHYIQTPGYQAAGHRTIANLHLSLLDAAGHPRKTFGDRDLKLDAGIDQSGPLREWMTG
jgi:hypothetical protein